MPLLADRVLETTTTTGTGSFALGGALTGYVTFNSVFSNGDIVFYTADNGQGEWEVGYGTVGTGTLSRTVIESSNANALVVFSAGTKRVFCTAPAKQLPPNQTGNSGKYLTTNGSDLSWVTLTPVTAVTGTAPIASSGGTTPAISISQSSATTDGYLSSTDWTTFNSKGSGSVTSVSGTGTVSGISLSGTVTTTGSLTLGGTLDLSSPPAIGGTAANTGKFTTLTATGTTTLATTLNGLIKTTAGVVANTTATLPVKNRAGLTISVALALS